MDLLRVNYNNCFTFLWFTQLYMSSSNSIDIIPLQEDSKVRPFPVLFLFHFFFFFLHFLDLVKFIDFNSQQKESSKRPENYNTIFNKIRAGPASWGPCSSIEVLSSFFFFNVSLPFQYECQIYSRYHWPFWSSFDCRKSLNFLFSEHLVHFVHLLAGTYGTEDSNDYTPLPSRWFLWRLGTGWTNCWIIQMNVFYAALLLLFLSSSLHGSCHSLFLPFNFNSTKYFLFLYFFSLSLANSLNFYRNLLPSFDLANDADLEMRLSAWKVLPVKFPRSWRSVKMSENLHPLSKLFVMSMIPS